MTSKSRAVVEGRPTELTDFGREIESCMDSCGWLSPAVGAVQSKVTSMRLPSKALPREIHKRSRRYVYFELPPAVEEKVKECASVNGTTEENVHRVLAVVLRDRLSLIKRLTG